MDWTPEQKRVTISSKRQFTIPQKFFLELGFAREAICTMGDGFLVIEPISPIPEGEFAEQILADLIEAGYSGKELLTEFRSRQEKVHPAIERMLEAAKDVANGKGEYSSYEDVFEMEN